jgi:hypothetical protein
MPATVKYLGWAATGLAIVLYAVMVGITLPHLARLAGGAAMFDLRPFGYDFGTAQAILAKLGSGGIAYYENVQHRLDFAFPILFALSLIFWMIVAARRWQGYGLPLSSAALGVILTIAIIGNAADLGENAAVSAMLAVGPRNLTPGLVDTASTFTMAKTFFAALSLLALAGLALGPWVKLLIRRGRR